jgi:hypothetical protein
MPVDFIKARLLNVDIPKLINNKLFSQKTETYIDKDEGECSKLILEYKNLVVTIYKNKVAILTGSLHYLYNNGEHNYNNFTFSSLINTLDEVANLLGLKLYQFKIQNIEFGINIKLPYNVSNITSNLLTHNQKEFLKPDNYDYKVAKHQRYWLKVYNKGEQFNRPNNILRVELKYKKMTELNKIGLHTFLDLLNKDQHNQLLTILLDKWSKALLYDFTIDKTQLRPLHFKKSLEFQNQNYWLNLSSQERTRQKKLLQTLSLEYGANTHQQISTLIEHQYKSLMI